MKITFFIRNHWSRSFGGGFYLIGIGYAFQAPKLVCWQIHLIGFCFCMFVDTEGTDKYPFPSNLSSWYYKKRYQWRKKRGYYD